MKPSRRSHLCDALRVQADTEGWRALIGQHGTPLLVLDRYRVVEQYRLLASHLPGFRLHYAVKTCAHPAVLRAVAASGGGFDVASNAEIDLIGALGLPLNRCIHTNPIKKRADIDHAYMSRRPHLRRRQSGRGSEIRGPARRHRHSGAACVPQSVGEIGSVDEVRR